MTLPLITLSWALLCQTVPDAPLVPIQSAERRASVAEVVAEVVALPEGTAVTGRPLTLLQALASAEGVEQQLDVTHAYWRLTKAVGELRLCWLERERLAGMTARPEDASVLQAARASASAALRLAEAAAVSAQYDLAHVAGLPLGDALPLPADLPHVDSYRTYFDEVFSLRNPPARARLIDQKLPLRLKTIQARALAFQAAGDAVEAASDAYVQGRADLGTVLSSVKQLDEQWRGLLRSVCDYNHDIADYALAVAGPQTDRRVVVAMLIKSSQPDAQGGLGNRSAAATASAAEAVAAAPSGPAEMPGGRSEVQPATHNVPASTAKEDASWQAAGPRGLRPLGDHAPTLAPPKGPSEPPAPQEPKQAEPPLGKMPEEAQSTPPAEGPQGGSTTAEAAPAAAANQADESLPQEPAVPVPPDPSATISRRADKPTGEPQTPSQPTLELYPALVDASPGVRPKLLSEQLHTWQASPELKGERVLLERCLSGPAAADRRRVIGAYWLVARRAAALQVLADHLNWLESLVPEALERRHEALAAEAMLDLRAAELAARADLLEAELDLRDAQFELTRCVGRPLTEPWLLPETPPHAGPYRLKLEAQRREVAASWTVRRLATVIPTLAGSLEDRAAAVVEADAARAAATRAYQSGTQPLGPVLAAIRCQTDETLAFLETLTQYNETIADYALAVLPVSVSAEQLAGTLVVTR